MSSTTRRAPMRAPRTRFRQFVSPISAIIIRSGLIVSAFIFSALLGRNAQAIEISIASVTLLPDTTPSGVYTGSGQGTSAWDNELTTLNPGGTASSTVGASATAEIRDAFSMSTVAPSDSAAAFSTTIHLSVTIEVQNDDPINNPVYQLGVSTGFSIVEVNGGAFLAKSFYTLAESPLHIGNGTSSFTAGPSGGGSGGFGTIGAPGVTPSGSGEYLPGSGTNFYTLDLELTNTTTANSGANISVLAGSDAGLNPLLGSSQHYPMLPPPKTIAPHTDPSLDGVFLLFTAKVTSAPEPDSWVSLLCGTLILGSALGAARWRQARARA